MKGNKVKWLLCVLAVSMLLLPLSSFAADDLISAFKEGSTSGVLRIYHWEKDYANSPSEDDSKSTLIGGILSYETAPLVGITAGVGMRVTHELIKHDDYGSYYYFFPQYPNPAGFGMITDTTGIEALSEAYLRYNNYDTMVTLGRQYIDTPYMNAHDFRLMPKAYQGVSLSNSSLNNIEFNLGYFTHYLDWDSPMYEKMISSAAIEEISDPAGTKAATYGGVVWTPIRGMSADVWYYQFEDVTSIITPNFKWFKVFNRDWKGFIDLRYAKWDAIGDKMAGDDYDTFIAGFIGGLIWKNWSLVLYGQQNGDHAPIEPYGHRRAVTMQVNWCELAEETAYAIKLGYDFSGIGVNGLSAYVRYGKFDTPDLGEENQAQDKTETEVTVQYDFDKSLEGLMFKVRYAKVDMDATDEWTQPGPPLPGALQPPARRQDADDLRIYLEYEF